MRIIGSRIYRVTTLPRVEDYDVQTMNLYWKKSASLFQSAEMSRPVYFRQMAAIKINIQRLLISISSILRPNVFCFGFDLNQSQRTRPISRNGQTVKDLTFRNM